MREVLFHQRPQNPHRALVPKPVIQAMLVALMRLPIFSLCESTDYEFPTIENTSKRLVNSTFADYD